MQNPGWTFHGSLAAGEEHYYESADGSAQVFPHPDSGWELQINGSADTAVFPSPEAAFAAHAEGCTMFLRPGVRCGQPVVVSVKSGGEVNRFCADCAKWGL